MVGVKINQHAPAGSTRRRTRREDPNIPPHFRFAYARQSEFSSSSSSSAPPPSSPLPRFEYSSPSSLSISSISPTPPSLAASMSAVSMLNARLLCRRLLLVSSFGSIRRLAFFFELEESFVPVPAPSLTEFFDLLTFSFTLSFPPSVVSPLSFPPSLYLTRVSRLYPASLSAFSNCETSSKTSQYMSYRSSSHGMTRSTTQPGSSLCVQLLNLQVPVPEIPSDTLTALAQRISGKYSPSVIFFTVKLSREGYPNPGVSAKSPPLFRGNKVTCRVVCRPRPSFALTLFTLCNSTPDFITRLKLPRAPPPPPEMSTSVMKRFFCLRKTVFFVPVAVVSSSEVPVAEL
mmetsp:Transcript_798/g.3086  ORF Transcript_798/g.3086 Transcript_798/m.3086 type:complete len:345 (-) Transcript_798:1463-2497(-)